MPGIHVLLAERKTWMAGTSPAMESVSFIARIVIYAPTSSRNVLTVRA
jgi:hypothetical protein